MGTILLLLIGVTAGVSGGFFGIGGGILIVPALVGFAGFTQQKAQGTSLVALIAPVGLFALGEYYRRGEVDLRGGAWIAGGFLIGGWVGSRFATGLDEVTMRRFFAVFLFAIQPLSFHFLTLRTLTDNH